MMLSEGRCWWETVGLEDGVIRRKGLEGLEDGVSGRKGLVGVSGVRRRRCQVI